MKKANVVIGSTYAAKVSGRVVPVRVYGTHYRKGWLAINTVTGREIHIISAQRLRHQIKEEGAL